MANFENGLPPQNIDISDKKISSVNYGSSEYKEKYDEKHFAGVSCQREVAIDVDLGLQGVAYNTDQLDKEFGIQSIVLQTEKVEGNNTVLFYL